MVYDGVVGKAWKWEDCEKIDVLKGTSPAKYAKEWGCGLVLIRRKIPDRYVGTWAAQCAHMFSALPWAKKVGKRDGAYESVQCTVDSCTCKDKYAGVTSHRVVHLPDPHCGVVSRILEYMHGKLEVCSGDEMEFNQVVANRYKVCKQDVPWHTDTSDLLGKNPTIISVSLGATGLFCFAPSYKAKCVQQSCGAVTRKQMKDTSMKGRLIEEGLNGMVPLGRGDILVMCGTFQECMVHKTVRNDELKRGHDGCKYPTVESLLNKYPAVNDRILPLVKNFWRHVDQTSMEDLMKELRFCVTLRRIKHHRMQPRCPCVPGILVCEDVHGRSTSRGVGGYFEGWNGACCTTPSTMTPSTTRTTTEDSSMDVWPEDSSTIPITRDSSMDSNVLPSKKRPRWQRSGVEMMEEWKENIAENVKWYQPRSTSPMCEEVLGKGESVLDDMEWYIQKAKEYLDELEDQVNQWEGESNRAWWKEFGFTDAAIDEYMEFLRESKGYMVQAVVVTELNAKAVRMLRTLRTFNKSRKAYDVVNTPESDDTRWAFGSSKSTDSRAYRVVMPFWYFEEIFRKADLKYFEQYGGVRIDYKDLWNPWQKLFILARTRDGKNELRPLKWARIGGGQFVEVRTIELALDYTSNMTRYQILQPKLHGIATKQRPDVLRRMLDEWVAVVTAVKQAQMQCTWRHEWPPEDMLPWWPTTLQWMPVVCWVRKQDPKKQR